MSKKANRFSKLEFGPILKIFKKQKDSSTRFLRLEVDGHKVKLEVSGNVPSTDIFCPKCGHLNAKDSLYCNFCSQTFEQNAQQTEAKNNKAEDKPEIEAWQKKCPGCGTLCNRNQKYCLYCGWRIAYWSEEDESPAQIGGKPVSSRYKKEIKLTIDGNIYSSNDTYVPADIRELMDKIDKEGYSKEMVESWVRERNAKQEIENASRSASLDSDIAEAQMRVVWRIIAVIASIAIPLILIWLRYTMHSH
ncbi:MAG: zinc ribbon domain-containing protein [Candidatus Omnitrophica bacterium]|nr:zinc ribbon domain-containing protein [Candidatus Omnitrophota bacterium]